MPTSRRRHPKGQGGLLRDELLASAAKILAEEGDGRRLSMRAVAAGARVTPPSVYRHFRDKAELLHAVVKAQFDAFDAFLDGAEAGAEDPCDRLRRRCHAYLEFAHSRPASYRLLFSATGLGPEAVGTEGKDWHPGAASFFKLVDNVADCLAARPGGAGRDAMAVSLLVWTQLHGCADLQLSKPELPWPPAVQLVDQALISFGLLEPPARSRRRGGTRAISG